MLRCFLLFTLFLCLSDSSMVAAQENDWGTWLDISSSREFRIANLSLNGEFYTKENNHKIDKFSLGLEGNRRITPFVSAGLGYLFMNIHHDNHFDPRNRVYTHLILMKHLANFKISTRQRMQVTLFRRSEANNEYYWRNLLKIEYGLDNWIVKPVASAESFFRVGNSLGNGFDEVRYLIGANVQLAARHELKIYSLLSSSSSNKMFITGVSYEICL